MAKTGSPAKAALDQSGGSTPHALAEYGIERDRYSSADEMFDLVHAMRTTLANAVATVRAQYEARKHPLHKQDRSFLQIHGKNKTQCPRCGHRISTIHSGGEATSFCRGCQL